MCHESTLESTHPHHPQTMMNLQRVRGSARSWLGSEKWLGKLLLERPSWLMVSFTPAELFRGKYIKSKRTGGSVPVCQVENKATLLGATRIPKKLIEEENIPAPEIKNAEGSAADPFTSGNDGNTKTNPGYNQTDMETLIKQAEADNDESGLDDAASEYE
ncbi:hypothetical protein H2200_007144 [Cladophialophora chaetospira]|uniref:Uncharacterized protein n=1 Tax=Cladophialophora chaetospira TaxID=386627 RepID=A0AA39CGU4_9EURO|nr:hypothetical protein H2200_007144 [Cladophialophora chaetospira]